MIDPAPASRTRFLDVATADAPMPLHGGGELGPVTMAFETWGELNATKDNAVLVFHALTGSHHAAGHDPVGPGSASDYWTEDYHHGWWDTFLGPGKAVDTDRWFVICANYLGGCYGSTGPASIDPATGKRWGGRFPWVTFPDVVDANMRLLDALGIGKLHAVIGGSCGGYCAADLAVRYPDRVDVVIPVASGLRCSTLTKVLNLEQIMAIENDPAFNGGDFYDGPAPERGVMLARMIGHKTFVSLDLIGQRAKGEIKQADDDFACYHLQDPVESYMLHQGRKFVPRFDANSYLRIMHAWTAFDLPRQQADGDAVATFAGCTHQRWLQFSIDSDVCFYPSEQAEFAHALVSAGVPCTRITVHSTKGHDSFLLEPDLYGPHLRQALETPRV